MLVQTTYLLFDGEIGRHDIWAQAALLKHNEGIDVHNILRYVLCM